MDETIQSKETTPNAGSKPTSGKRAHVRFSDKEYDSLCAESVIRGLSIPEILKESYFGERPTSVLMGKEDIKRVLGEMIRQGNNLNQIARRLNAGYPGVIERELQAIKASYNAIVALIRSKVQAA